MANGDDDIQTAPDAISFEEMLAEVDNDDAGNGEKSAADLEAVFDAAVETGTAIEVNSNLNRLDASADVIREGARRGVRFVISTDAHTTRELDNHRHGARQARRGGVPADQVVNTWDLDRFLGWIDDVRSA